MKRRWMAVALCALIAGCLGGCQLAREGAGALTQTDRLVGMLVTTQSLDLFDFERYLEDNAWRFTGGDVEIDGNAPAYQGRLYARRVERVPGEPGDEYVFDGVDGFPFFVATEREPGGAPDEMEAGPWTGEGNRYTTTVAGPEISDMKLAVHNGDTERRTTLTGTIYVAPGGGERTVYMNPVYQDADGNVYAMSGDMGYMIGDWTDSEGEHYAQTLDDAVTVTEDGVSMTDRMSVTLAVSVLFTPERVVVVRMNERHECLAQEEVAPELLPEELVLGPDVAYLVVETHQRDTMGEARVARTLYGRDAAWINTFVAKADGIYAKRETQLVWPD